MTKILLVEDDRYLNKLMSDRLFRSGFQLKSCLDGESAWQALHSEKEPFDVVIVDLLLPKLMGDDLLTKINASQRFMGLRKIVISGVFKSENQIKEITKVHQLESFWTKPFDLDELISSLKNEKKFEKSPLQADGSLHKNPIERIFFEAYEKNFSGRLTIRNKSHERRVYFMNGHPVAADSSAVNESLGIFLVSIEEITEEVREKVAKMMVQKESFFGEVLLQLKLVTKDRLFELLRKHNYQLLLNSFLARQGEYVLEASVEIPSHLPLIEFNPFLLMQAAQTRLLPFSALEAIMRLKRDYFPEMNPQVGQLLYLLNLQEVVMEQLKSLNPAMDFFHESTILDPKDQESFFRTIYLFESIGLVAWKKPSEASFVNLEIPHVNFAPIIKKEKTSELLQTERQISADYIDAMNKNYFDLLGISFDADARTIEQAYWKAQYQFDPNRFNQELTGLSRQILHDMMKRINEAFQTLSNPTARKEYTQRLEKNSISSLANSQAYLQAIELHREGKILFEKGFFREAKAKFEQAQNVWKIGVEYKAYSVYCDFKLAAKKLNRMEMTRVIHRMRDLAYSNLQSEVCFVLLGHACKAAKQKREAREAYQKALELNPHNSEAEHALASVFEGQSQKVKWNPEIRLPSGSSLKWTIYVFSLAIAAGLAWYSMQPPPPDPSLVMVPKTLIDGIFSTIEVSHKGDLTKIFVRNNTISEMPRSILQSKCLQSLDRLRAFNSQRVYIIEETKGLKAICTHELLQKF
jgi:curved DNA-binding protein CbpA/CheY-like chemotaxis protein